MEQSPCYLLCITGIPTAILVDQEGKVVSLKARGRELDRLLVELLGEVEPEPAESDGDESAERVNRNDGDE